MVRQFPQNLAVFMHDFPGKGHLLCKLGIVRSQFNSIRKADQKEPVTLANIEGLKDLFTEDRTERIAYFADDDGLFHSTCVITSLGEVQPSFYHDSGRTVPDLAD